MKFKDLSLEEIIDKIKSSETTREDVFNYFLGRINKYDNKLQCFNFINEKWLNNKDWSLFWTPIAVKDLYCEKGIPTTGSSKMLADFVPPYDATIIKKLKEEGMSSIGKVTMDEFAMWTSWESSALKKAVNPWGTNRIPWGSSSWSAVAVSAGLVPAALWTDTWGSLRQPASLCWVVGFRPSYGRNSRFWIMPMASSLDCPWTITKTVKDAGLLYEIMNGEDSLENTSLPGKDIINEKIWETKDLKWFKIWVVKEFFWDGLDAWVKKVMENSVKELKEMWAEIKEISLPMIKYAIAAYYIIVPAEVSTNLWRLDGIRYWHVSDKEAYSMDSIFQNNRWEWLWAEAQRRTVLWAYVLSAWFYDAYFKKASQVRTLIIEDFNKAFKEVDVIIWPASPSVAWKMWEVSDDPLKLYLADMYTIPSSLAWLPGISVPCW
jgi:aspartyl-tRNA(Asn)/glutamyl-tRNA(Gln) amidotransferase subunit A